MASLSSTTRRSLLVAAPAIIVAIGSTRRAAPALAAVAPADNEPGFLRLSQFLTGHRDLDPITAARMSQDFAAVDPAAATQFAALCGLIRPAMSPADLLAAAQAAGLKTAALAIVAAWYTGMVGKGVYALTVSYVDALMQRPVADALAPPTYVLGGPAWWTAPPPAVGLSCPVMRAPAPATVGNPGPTPQ